MGHTGDKGVAGTRRIDDAGGDGLELAVLRAVAAVHPVAAHRDIDLLDAQGSQVVGSGLGGVAVGNRLRLYQVEFQAVQTLCLALLQRLDDTGCLGSAHGVNHERCGAMVDEVLQRLGRDVGVGYHK